MTRVVAILFLLDAWIVLIGGKGKECGGAPGGLGPWAGIDVCPETEEALTVVILGGQLPPRNRSILK